MKMALENGLAPVEESPHLTNGNHDSAVSSVDRGKCNGIAHDIYICDLCNNMYDNPKILPCLHTYCGACLNDHIVKSIRQNGQRHFNCPSCETKVEVPMGIQPSSYTVNIPEDLFMSKVVELTKALHENKFCDICQRREEDTKANNFCMDCYDALCENCLKVHLHGKVTSGHVVITMDDVLEMPLEEIMKKRNKVPCHKHGDFITLFCVDCREPLCVQCMSVSHRRCENVITVSDAMTSEFDVNDVVSRLKNMQEMCENSDGLSKLEDILEQSIEKSRREIKSLSDTLCTRIRDQEAILLQELEKKTNESRKTLSSRTEPRRARMKSINSAGDRMDTLLKYGSEVEILMAYNQVRKQLEESEKLLNNFSFGNLLVKVNFTQDTFVEQMMDEFEVLGKLSLEAEGSDEGLSSWGVTCTSMEEIIVTDCNNRRIQKFSKSGELVDHVQLDDEPRDITTCGVSDDVALTVIGKLILFLTTRKTMHLIKKTKTKRQYDSISYSKFEGVLTVSSIRDKVVDIIQLDGSVLRSFEYGPSGAPLFVEPRYVAASADGTIIVTDVSKQSVICLDHEGNILFNYNPEDTRGLKKPQGVCLDKIGNVFVADNGNNRIELLTSEGAFQRFVLGKENGLERPVAIVVSSSNRLVIVQNDGMVKVFSYN